MFEALVPVSGVGELELDGGSHFFWVEQHAVFEASDDGLLRLEGTAAVDVTVEIKSPTSHYTVNLKRGRSSTIEVPLKKIANVNSKVELKFSDYLKVDGDHRQLAFKVNSCGYQKTVDDYSLGTLAHSDVMVRGVSQGRMSESFASGWLRMSAARQGDRLKISGIIAKPMARSDEIALLANDVSITDIEYGLYNPDYDFLGDIAFEGEVSLSEFEGDDFIRFSTIYAKTGEQAISPEQDWFFPLKSSLPLPQTENMSRIGSQESDWFLFSGFSFVKKVETLFKRFGQMPLNGKANIVDWGCGCGRLSRHILEQRSWSLTGIDIDPVNIEWCQKNLSSKPFHLVSPDLPTKIDTQSQDILIGHSVFTHLAELDQFMWLAEINRILKPGGLALVTVMGSYSASIEKMPLSSLTTLIEKGFLDVGWQDDGVDSQKPGFYRRVFHTIDYVKTEWSKYLEVVGVIEGFSDHQAAIVLRKPEECD